MVRPAKKENRKNNKDPLEEHELAAKIAKEPGQPANAILLAGYIINSGSKDIVRLALNLNFDEYIDIPKDKILHAAVVPENILEFGGTYVWIESGTEIKHVNIRTTKKRAEFLEGEITERYRGLLIAPHRDRAGRLTPHPGLMGVSIYPQDCPGHTPDLPCESAYPCESVIPRLCNPRSTDQNPCKPPDHNLSVLYCPACHCINFSLSRSVG